MFQDLHALAQGATLMIVVSSEGDDLRVSVTPTQNDKSIPTPVRPLSLLGTPEELDAGFAIALQTWRAPRMSIVDQAKAQANDEAPAKPAAAAKPKADAPAKSKPARAGKSKVEPAAAAPANVDRSDTTATDATATQPPAPAAGVAPADSTAAEPGSTQIGGEATKGSGTAAVDSGADVFTLELF